MPLLVAVHSTLNKKKISKITCLRFKKKKLIVQFFIYFFLYVVHSSVFIIEIFEKLIRIFFTYILSLDVFEMNMDLYLGFVKSVPKFEIKQNESIQRIKFEYLIDVKIKFSHSIKSLSQSLKYINISSITRG